MVTAPARLDFASATAAVAALDRSLRSGNSGNSGSGSSTAASRDGAASLDLSALTHFDSSALAVLLELRRRFGGTGGPFRAVNPPAKLYELAEVYGVADLLFGSPAAARQ